MKVINQIEKYQSIMNPTIQEFLKNIICIKSIIFDFDKRKSYILNIIEILHYSFQLFYYFSYDQSL